MHEAVIDIPKQELDSSVFLLDSHQPTLLPEVRQQILTLASHYSQWGRISQILLIGSILTKQYDAESDLDVTIIMAPFSTESYDFARHYAGDTWETDYVNNTAHPINFYVRDEWDTDLADQIYDVLGNGWEKQTDVTPIDIDNYYKTFQGFVQQIDVSKGELKRDLIDFDILNKFDADAVTGLQELVHQKLDEIDVDVKRLVGSYKTIHALRRLAFRKDLTPEDIAKYQIRNKLPANVVYKFLERYHYLQFLGAITKALDSAGGQIDSPGDVNDVKQALRGNATSEHRILQSVISELTGAGAAGAYDVPLGALPAGRKKRRKRKKAGVKEYV